MRDKGNGRNIADRSLQIQKVPRRVLKVILSLEAGKSSKEGSRQAKTGMTLQGTSKPPLADTTTALPFPITTTSDEFRGRLLTIIQEESGLSSEDIRGDVQLADLGIDSLMGLTISARLKDEFDVDIDFISYFAESPTVDDLISLVDNKYPGCVRNDSLSSVTTLETLSSSSDDFPPTPPDTTTTTPEELPSKSLEKVLAIISEESGIDVEDLTDEVAFADSGIDSLLSLIIADRLRGELDLDIHHDALFLECNTLGDLKAKLGYGHAKPGCLEIKLEQASDEPARISTPLVGDLAIRRHAVEKFVEKYSIGFKHLAFEGGNGTKTTPAKVVLVTGASGSLGGHLVQHLANLDEVTTVICLNRKNNAEPYARQYRAMREKGIRFPDNLRFKLKVLASDTSKKNLGLGDDEYQTLSRTVTHIVHNAWPMSAKQPLAFFEPQFQVLRNLLDLAVNASSNHQGATKVSFALISSIGVVGNYDPAGNQATVPESPVDFTAVLRNGYGEAKWGCEKLLDLTLRKHPEHFRTMVVRLGQIAGSRKSGYWNPMEHFGFLIKSAQTLKAFPDLRGRLFWTPVEDVAGTVSDLVLGQHIPHPVYHVENPVGQHWEEAKRVLLDALKMEAANVVPFEKWLQLVRQAGPKDNPAATLVDFLDDTFVRLACGGLVLETKHSVEHSPTLAQLGPVDEIVLRKYIHIWKEIGFLKATQKEKDQFEEERLRLWGPRTAKT